MGAGSNVAELSAYIIAFAAAAAVAQKAMSTQEQPMQIKEYMFDINISADFNLNSETDVGLTVWGITLKEKLTLGYSDKMGIEIKCTIVPLAVVTASVTG